MTGLSIPAAPIVAPGAAARLDDRYVDRVVMQWLDAVQSESRLSRNALMTFFGSPLGRMGGNEKAQMRWVGRVRRIFGERMMRADMKTGNRAKFHLTLDLMQPMSAIRQFDYEGDVRNSPPEWLAGIRLMALWS